MLKGEARGEGRRAKSSPQSDLDSRSWRYGRTAVGIAFGLALLALVALGSDLEAVWVGIQEVDPLWVSLALLAVLMTTAAKVVRWHDLFPVPKGLRYYALARALLVAQLINALVPARLGEVARFYTLGRDEQVSKATVIGTIASEKAFDVFFLLAAAGLTATLASLPPWLHGALAGVATLAGAVLAAAVVLPRGWMLETADCCTVRLPGGLAIRPKRWLAQGLKGLESLRDPRRAAISGAWTAVIWALAAITNLLVFRACDLSLSLGPALLLLTLLHVGMAPPSSPGRIGVFHAITVVGLRPFGVERPLSLAYATVLHAVVYGPQILLGALALVVSPSPPEEGM